MPQTQFSYNLRSTELCRENCKNDAQCKVINSKELCLNQQCASGCKTNKDCPDGSTCYKDTCQASCGLGSYCGSSYYCHPVHHVCVPKCKSNNDLESGYGCSQGKGGFQLLYLIIMELKSHMTCYNSMPLIG